MWMVGDSTRNTLVCGRCGRATSTPRSWLSARTGATRRTLFDTKCGPFRSEVEESCGRVLPNDSRAFAVYHCGARIRNTHRPMAEQREDWKRLRPFLNIAG